MKIASIIFLLGVINFALILFQIGTGSRFIKVPFAIHKRTGLLLLLTSFLHGALAVYVNYLS